MSEPRTHRGVQDRIGELYMNNGVFRVQAQKVIRAAAYASKSKDKKSWLGKSKWPEAHADFIAQCEALLNLAYRMDVFSGIAGIDSPKEAFASCGREAFDFVFPCWNLGSESSDLIAARNYYLQCVDEKILHWRS